MTPHTRYPAAHGYQSGRAGPVQRMLAVVVLGTALVGVPWLQLHLVGKPWPAAMPGWETIWFEARSFPPPDAFVIKSASVIVWLLWGCFILLLLSNLIDVTRILRHEGHLVPAGWMQTLAATLIGTTVATTPTTAIAATGPATAEAPLQPGTPPSDPAPTSVPTPGPDTRPRHHQGALSSAEDPAEGAAYLEVVRFGFNADQLADEQARRLTTAVTQTRHLIDPGRPIIVEGHTDHFGPASYNMELSMRRARAAAQLLHELLPNADVRVIARGETRPRHPETHANGTDDPIGRATNRRAEIHLPIKPARPPEAPPSSSGGVKPRSDTQRSGEEPAGVELPGGYVAGGFAAGVAVLLALARLARARRRGRGTRAATPQAEPLAWPGGNHLQQAAMATTHEDTSTDYRRSATKSAAALPPGHDSASAKPLLDPYGRLAIAAEGDQLLYADLSSGFALRPPEAADGVLRAALAAVLLPVPGQPRNQVITTITTARRLGLDPTQELLHVRCCLTITSGLPEALRECETGAIRAARQLGPSGSSGRLVLLTDAPAAEADRERLTHILAGPAVLALLAGDWLHGGDLQPGGRITLPAADRAPLDEGRAFTLSAEDLAGLLATIAAPAADAALLTEAEQATTTAPAQPQNTPATAGTTEPEDLDLHAPAEAAQADPAGHDTAEADRPVLLTVLGTARVLVGGAEVTTGLRSHARALLAHLVIAHPHGLTSDALGERLGDGDQPATRETRQAAVSNARKVLRHATGAAQAAFITHTAGRYHLDAGLIDADLWRFTRALQAAHDRNEPVEQVHALRTAIDLYTGPLATEDDPALAEQLRRQAADAATRLADLTEDPEQALAHLEAARALDPENEPLYRDIMTRQARLGRGDAARRTYRLLTTHLAGLGAAPEPATEALLTKLLQPEPGEQEQ